MRADETDGARERVAAFSMDAKGNVRFERTPDGGPADTTYNGPSIEINHRGLTIRDRFAMAALPGLFEPLKRWREQGKIALGNEAKWLAIKAYQIADAMLAERGRK